MTGRARLTTVLFAFIVMLPVQSATSGQEWSAPEKISTPCFNGPSQADLAVDALGNAIAIWDCDKPPVTIQASERQAGGQWSTPYDLSGPEDSVFMPQIAVGSSGDAVAVWLSRAGGSPWVLEVTHRDVGGSWSAPDDLSTSDRGAGTPQVAVDASGNAIVVWRHGNVIQVAERPAGGEWSGPTDLSDPSKRARLPQVALDPSGNAVVVWNRILIQAVYRPAGASWSGPVDVSARGRRASFADVAMDPSGKAIAVWSRGGVIQSALRRPGGNWSTPKSLTSLQTVAPEIAIDGLGNAFAVWERYSWDASRSKIQIARRPVGGTWSSPRNLSRSREAYWPNLAVDPSGNAIVIWEQPNVDTPYGIASAHRPVGGPWSAPVNVSRDIGGGSARVSLDGSGNAVAVWLRRRGVWAAIRPAGE